MTLHKSQDERRRDILEAARGRFVVDGYSRARLNDIALDAGLSKGGVYFHFKSKREIFDALIDEDFERVMLALKAMRGLTGSCTDKLISFAQAGFRSSITNPVVPRFFIVMGEMALAHDDVRARVQEIHEAFVTEVRAILEGGVAKGELRQDLDTDTAARLLVTLMDGVRAAVAGDLHKPRQFERLLADGGRLLTEGFLPGAPKLG
jgi:AcrR family transcriptional regulator